MYLCPPDVLSSLALGVDPGNKKEEEEDSTVFTKTTEGSATGSFVRGHGKPLDEFPQSWGGVVAQTIATVSQEGVDTLPAGEPDWLKIIDLEGVPKPLPKTKPNQPSESKGEGPETNSRTLPSNLQHQTFQRQKSPRSILPPLDGEQAPTQSIRARRAAEAEAEEVCIMLDTMCTAHCH